MKSKVNIGIQLEKNVRVNGLKRDVLIFAAVDLADLSQPLHCHRLVLDRADEGKNQRIIEKTLKDYVRSLPPGSTLSGILHKTHSHGTPHREQHRVLGFRRATVMGPDPITEEARLAIESFADSEGIAAKAAHPVRGDALSASEDFFGRIGLNYLDAKEKRALMLALEIKTRSFASQIEKLENRHTRALARRTKLAKKGLKVA